MEPVIDHIQVTVKDMSVAVPFYDKLLPLLGFEASQRVHTVIEEHELHVLDYTHPQLGFTVSSPREAFADDTICRRKPGALHHLAFKANSREEVDRFYAQVKAIGAVIVAAPGIYTEYSPHYYAVFFKDLEGIKYEVVCDKPEEP